MSEVTDKARHIIKICPANKPNECIDVKALFDTGSSISMMNQNIGFKLIKQGADFTPVSHKFGTAGADQLQSVAEMPIDITIDGCKITQDALAHPEIVIGLSEDFIFGLKDMQLYGVEVNAKQGKVVLLECPPKFKVA